MPVESLTQSLCDLALRFGEDDDEGGGMVSRFFFEDVNLFAYYIIIVSFLKYAESSLWCGIAGGWL